MILPPFLNFVGLKGGRLTQGFLTHQLLWSHKVSNTFESSKIENTKNFCLHVDANVFFFNNHAQSSFLQQSRNISDRLKNWTELAISVRRFVRSNSKFTNTQKIAYCKPFQLHFTQTKRLGGICNTSLFSNLLES